MTQVLLANRPSGASTRFTSSPIQFDDQRASLGLALVRWNHDPSISAAIGICRDWFVLTRCAARFPRFIRGSLDGLRPVRIVGLVGQLVQKAAWVSRPRFSPFESAQR